MASRRDTTSADSSRIRSAQSYNWSSNLPGQLESAEVQVSDYDTDSDCALSR